MKHAVAACAVATLVWVAPVSAQDVTFAYAFESGSVEKHSVKLNQEIDMGGMAMSHIVDMRVTLKCVAAKDGKYSMEMTFDQVDVSMAMMGNTSQSPLGQQLTGKAIMFTVDSAGNVTDVTPMGAFDDWGTAQQVVEPVVENWYPYLPNRAVAVGGSWEKKGEKQKDASGTESVTNATYKYKGTKKEKSRDVVLVEQLLDSTISGKSNSPMGTYVVAGTGKGKGEFAYESAKSRVVRVKGNLDLNMEMTPEAGGKAVTTVLVNQLERVLLD